MKWERRGSQNIRKEIIIITIDHKMSTCREGGRTLNDGEADRIHWLEVLMVLMEAKS